jgi:hypothetical protein
MALTWRSSAAYIPAAATDIWVRIYWWQGEPVLAQYNSTTEEITVNLNGLVIPFWAVSRWAYPEGEEPTENEPEVEQYILDLETELSSAMIAALNLLVTGLKEDLNSEELLEDFDAIWLLRGETEESTLKNLVQDLFHCTAVNSPTFTQYAGYSGNGTNQYLEPDYVFGTDSVRFTQNDASHGVGFESGTIGGLYDLPCGVYGATYETVIAPGGNGSETWFAVNSAVGVAGAQNTSAAGIYVADRSGTSIKGYKNGNEILNGTQSSEEIQTINDRIMLVNGISGGGFTGIHTLRFIGRHFNATEQAAIAARFETYIETVGGL